MEPPTFLDKHQALLDFFGYWPSFRDANVLSYVGPAPGRSTVDLTLHTWEMTSEVDAKGYFVLRKHVLVAFHFATSSWILLWTCPVLLRLDQAGSFRCFRVRAMAKRSNQALQPT